jgi:hypothetical protein
MNRQDAKAAKKSQNKYGSSGSRVGHFEHEIPGNPRQLWLFSI